MGWRKPVISRLAGLKTIFPHTFPRKHRFLLAGIICFSSSFRGRNDHRVSRFLRSVGMSLQGKSLELHFSRVRSMRWEM